MSVIKLSKIKKSFSQAKESFNILNDIDLTVNESEIISLIGPSGSGKTTLLQICGLLDSPSSGKIEIDDVDCSNLTEEKATDLRRNNIGFIYQFHHLLPEFTALENVIIPQMIKGMLYSEAAIKAEEILCELGLKGRLKNLPSELSGGEKQRIAIARALINKPKLILADEPTGNLDPKNSDLVFNILLKEVRNRKVSTIIVTHNLELAKKTDRILTIKNGQLSDY